MLTQIDHTINPNFNPDSVPQEQTFKISGTPLECIQALAYVRALGGGHVYIAKGLLSAKHQYYLGHPGPVDIKGRLNDEDIEIIQSLAQNCSYVSGISVWAGEIVDWDLDKIDYTIDMDNRFNRHPMDRFGKVCNVHWTQWNMIKMSSWLDIPANVGRPTGKGIVVTGSGWEEREVYKAWAQQGLGNMSTFLGSEADYKEWVAITGIKMTRVGYKHVAELAQWISGAQQVICTPGWGAAIAQAINQRYLVQSLPGIELWRNPWVIGERGNNGPF
jgi:hypothetical protein